MQPWAQSLAAVTSSSCCAAEQSFCDSHALVHDAGTVLITFKSRLSLPPYRIENATSDVAIWFAQVCILAVKQAAKTDGPAVACHHQKIVHASDCLLSELERVKQLANSAKPLSSELLGSLSNAGRAERQ